MNLKPGHQSTEFWMGLATAIIVPIVVKFGVMDEQTALASVGAIAAYILSRGWAKSGNGNGVT